MRNRAADRQQQLDGCATDDLALRHLSAPYFLATKFEAFKDRGHNDVYLSHDLEDIMTVVEGRATIVQEVSQASQDVRRFIAESVSHLFALNSFGNALPGLLSNADREESVTSRLQQIKRLI